MNHQIKQITKTMKKQILIIALLFIGIFSTNAQTETCSLTVQISGLNSDKGTLIIGVYNKKENFLKKEFRGKIVQIKNQKSTVVFKDLPKGEYAVSFIHDENDNNELDTNFLGIPKEDYGCSNNTRGFMGPPKYKNAKFQLTENKTINIKI